MIDKKGRKRLTVWLPKDLYAGVWLNKFSTDELITDFVVSAIREKLLRTEKTKKVFDKKKGWVYRKVGEKKESVK